MLNFIFFVLSKKNQFLQIKERFFPSKSFIETEPMYNLALKFQRP